MANVTYDQAEALKAGNTKFIHQIWWQGFDQVPSKYTNYVQSMHYHNPSYTTLIWDEASVLKMLDNHFPTYSSSFKNIELRIIKIDIAKWFILQRYGHFLVDTDMECFGNLESVLDDPDTLHVSYMKIAPFYRACSSMVKLDLSINNAFFYSPAGNPLLDKLIDGVFDDTLSIYRKWEQSSPSCQRFNLTIMVTKVAGPTYVSKKVKQFIQEGEKVVVLPHYLVEARPTQYIPDKTIIVHHSKVTWAKEFGKIQNTIENIDVRVTSGVTVLALTGVLVGGIYSNKHKTFRVLLAISFIILVITTILLTLSTFCQI
jgi:hypothetical protein